MNILLLRRSRLASSVCVLLSAIAPLAVAAEALPITEMMPVSRSPMLAQANGAGTAPPEAATAPLTAPIEAPPSLQTPGAAPQPPLLLPPATPPVSPTAAYTEPRTTPAIVVAPLFEIPGVLTPMGKFVVEPSLQYGYSSSNRVSLIGYTVIPAILIGLIDVREVKRNTFTAALTGRYGVTNRFELEARVPYVYRSDATVSREIFTGSSVDGVFDASGRALGDTELAARYQLNDGELKDAGNDKLFYVATMRFKSRTGRDPFQVVTDCASRCVANSKDTGLPRDLPTGSGFYSLQPGVTWLYSSDPAVFFGSFTYLHNFKRNDVSRAVVNGSEFLGTVAPGDIFGFNFGMGLALNEKSSFSIGYDHNSVGRTKLNGATVPGSVRSQLGTLLVGYAFRINPKTSLSVSIGAGLTRDTPDVTLTMRLPITF